jgi:hypothetical protein
MRENIRDGLLWTLGSIGFLNELFFGGLTERPFMLTLIAAFFGLPLVLRAEGRARNGNKNGGKQ